MLKAEVILKICQYKHQCDKNEVLIGDKYDGERSNRKIRIIYKAIWR